MVLSETTPIMAAATCRIAPSMPPPLFNAHGELILIQALQAHQSDTGSKNPQGFSVDSTDTFGEYRVVSKT
jgi:hypothetical protein